MSRRRKGMRLIAAVVALLLPDTSAPFVLEVLASSPSYTSGVNNAGYCLPFGTATFSSTDWSPYGFTYQVRGGREAEQPRHGAALV